MAKPVYLCAHGAGGHKDDASMLRLARAVEAAGVEVARFNFAYREKGSKRPDPMPELVSFIKEKAKPFPADRLILGGRSMGGRAASMLAAEGFPCAGLILAAYPLHPAGQPEKLRVAHLAKVACPVLCLNGTRDPLCERNLMEQALQTLDGRWTMHWIEKADHSFHVLKSSGRTDAEVDAEVSAAVADWLSGIMKSRGGSAV